MNNNNNNTSVLMVIIIIFVLFCLIKSCSEPSESEIWHQEHKQSIDDYNYRHRNDRYGYKGTRRNSWAEDNELKSDGYDPDKYREQHGY